MTIPTCYAMLNTAAAFTAKPGKYGHPETEFEYVLIYPAKDRVNIAALDGNVAIRVSYTYDGYQTFDSRALWINKAQLNTIKDQFLTIDLNLEEPAKAGKMKTVNVTGDGRNDCLVSVHVPAREGLTKWQDYFEKVFLPNDIDEVAAASCCARVNISMSHMQVFPVNQYGWKSLLPKSDNRMDYMSIRPVVRDADDEAKAKKGSGLFYVNYPEVKNLSIYRDIRIEGLFMGWETVTSYNY